MIIHRTVTKNDIILTYSHTCPQCLSGFKEGQEIIRDNNNDFYHTVCYEEKCQQK